QKFFRGPFLNCFHLTENKLLPRLIFFSCPVNKTFLIGKFRSVNCFHGLIIKRKSSGTIFIYIPLEFLNDFKLSLPWFWTEFGFKLKDFQRNQIHFDCFK